MSERTPTSPQGFEKEFDPEELEHRKNQDNPVVEALSSRANAINKLRSNINAEIKQLRVQYEIDKRNGNTNASFEQVLAENSGINDRKKAIKKAEDNFEADLIRFKDSPFMTERIVNELIDATDNGPATYKERDEDIRLDVMLHIHQMANEVDSDIADVEEALKTASGMDRNSIKENHIDITNKILARVDEIDGLLSGVHDGKTKREIAEQAYYIINERLKKANKIYESIDQLSRTQAMLGMESPPKDIIAKLTELTDKFDKKFNDVASKKQQISVSEYSEYERSLTDTLEGLEKAVCAEADNIIDDSVRKSTLDRIRNEVADRMEKIETLFYSEQRSADDAEVTIEEIANDSESSPEEKKKKLAELIKENPQVQEMIKGIGAVAAAVMIFMTSTVFSLGDSNAKTDNSINSNTVRVEDNFQGKSESFTEYLKGYEQGFSFEKHKEGDPIVFDVEVYKKLQEERTAPNAHMAFGPSLEKLLQERNMEYTPENVLKSFLENAYHNPKIVIGHFMDREVAIDGDVIKVTNDNADEIFAKMKNDSGFYGKIYDTFLKEVNKDGNIVKFGHAKTNDPSIYSVLDAHGRTYFGTSFNYNGDSDTIIIIDKDGNAIGEYRIKCSGQKTGITKTIIPSVKEDPTPDPEPNPEPEPEPELSEETPSDDDLTPPIPNIPDAETPRDDTPVDPTRPGESTPTPPETPKPKKPTVLEAKDGKENIEVSQNLNKGTTTGGQRFSDGKEREPEESSSNTTNEILQENLIQQEQQRLKEQEKALDEYYKSLFSPEEEATVTENETGAKKVNESYDDAAKNAETVVSDKEIDNDKEVDDDEIDGMVSPI